MAFRGLTVSIVLLLSSLAPAAAQHCWDLWYDRNVMYAERGFCFGGPISQAVFGTRCSTASVELTGAAKARLMGILAEERARGCVAQRQGWSAAQVRAQLTASGRIGAPPRVGGTSLAEARLCWELWFDRNALFAERGYCFDGPVSTAVFGTSCSAAEVELTGAAKERMEGIVVREAQLGCVAQREGWGPQRVTALLTSSGRLGAPEAPPARVARRAPDPAPVPVPERAQKHQAAAPGPLQTSIATTPVSGQRPGRETATHIPGR